MFCVALQELQPNVGEQNKRLSTEARFQDRYINAIIESLLLLCNITVGLPYCHCNYLYLSSSSSSSSSRIIIIMKRTHCNVLTIRHWVVGIYLSAEIDI